MYYNVERNTTPSSGKLIYYLDKEVSLSKELVGYLDKESEIEKDYFFNEDNYQIEQEQVIDAIDNNCKGLTYDEARFYNISLDPSKKEIEHIYRKADEIVKQMLEADKDNLLKGENVENLKDKIIKNLFKEYAIHCMDIYAQNFQREGITSAKDLVWFGRVEKYRYWKRSTSKEVRYNERIFREIKKLEKAPQNFYTKKAIEKLTAELITEREVLAGGRNIPIYHLMPKSGLNYHIHIIVSRRDKNQKYKLSPLAKQRGNDEHLVAGKKCTIGFNRNLYANKVEEVFDTNFSYSREIKETYEYRKKVKQESKSFYSQNEEKVWEENIKSDLGIESLDGDWNENEKAGYKRGYSEESLKEYFEEEDLELIKLIAYKKAESKFDNVVLTPEQFAKEKAKEINKMVSEYKYSGTIILPKIDEIKKYNKEIFVKKPYELLTAKDYENMKQIAVAKCNALEILENERDKYIAKEIQRMEFSYYSRGIIFVPEPCKNLLVDENKFKLTDYKLLIPDDYNVLTYIAKAKAKCKSFDDDSFSKNINKEISKLESSYYSRGFILIPKDEGNPSIENADVNKFRKVDFDVLNENDYNVIIRTAELKIKQRYSEEKISKKRLEFAIKKEIDLLESYYYNRGIVSVGKDPEQLYVVDTKKFKEIQYPYLTERDYRQIREIATKKIIEKYDSLTDKEQFNLIEKEIQRMEYEYYDKGKILSAKYEGLMLEENKIFHLSEYAALRREDYKEIFDCATRQVDMKVQFFQLSANEREQYINSAVQQMEREYYLSGEIKTQVKGLNGNIFVPVNETAALTVEDYRTMFEVSKLMVHNKFGNSLTDIQANIEIYKEINRLESMYQNYGSVMIPNMQGKIEFDTVKFQESRFVNLSHDDYQILENIAQIKVDNKFGMLSGRDKKREIAREFSQMEYSYYTKGTILIPDVIKDFPPELDMSKYIISEYTVLSQLDYHNMRCIAEAKIQEKYPELSEEERITEINREVTRMETTYYKNGKIIVPDIKQNLSLDVHKFELLKYSQLDENTYNQIKEVAIRKVEEKYDPLTDKERSNLINREIQRMEYEYYDKGKILSAKYEGLMLEENKIFHLSEYAALRREDYKEIFDCATRQVDMKLQFLQSSANEREQYINSAVQQMEREYYLSGKIKADMDNFKRGIFIRVNEVGLTDEDYKNIFEVSKLGVQSKLGDSLTDVLWDAEIYKEMGRLESMYRNYGQIIVPNMQGKVEFDTVKFQESRFVNLSHNDYQILENIAQIKVDDKFGMLSEQDKKREIARELSQMEYSYYTKGTILIPDVIKDASFGLDQSKFIISEHSILSQLDYHNMRCIAEAKIQEKYPELSEEERIMEVNREVTRMETTYYKNGKMLVPDVRLELPFDTNKFEFFKYPYLTKCDYELIKEIAIRKVGEKYDPLTDKERSNLINREIQRMEYEYYDKGKILSAKYEGLMLEENKIFHLSEYAALRREDYKEIFDCATRQVDMKLQFLQSSANEREQYINSAVQQMEREYYLLGEMKKQELNLTKEDYRTLFEVSKLVVQNKFENSLTDIQWDTEIYKEMSRLESMYQNYGSVMIPNMQGKIEFDTVKFQESRFVNLSHDDYQILESIAQIKVDAKFEMLSEQDKKREIARELSKMEYSYYTKGTILIPDVIKDFPPELDMSKYVISEYAVLSQLDYHNMRCVAEAKIQEKYPELSEEERSMEVNWEITRMENTYYKNGQIIIPDIKQNLSLDESKFIVSDRIVLDSADYQNIREAAILLLEEKYRGNSIPKAEMEYLIKQEINKIEATYYRQTKEPILRKIYNEWLHRTSYYLDDWSNKIFLPQNGNYKNIDKDKFRISEIPLLNSNDYKIINEVAEMKIRDKYEGVEIMESVYQSEVFREVFKMESTYYKEGTIDIPFLEQKSIDLDKFNIVKCETLKPVDYDNIRIAATINVMKEKNVQIGEPKDFAEDIDKEIAKLEFIYYKNGHLNLPPSDCYQNLDPKKFSIISRRSLVGSLSIAAINAVTNCIGEDIRPYKEVVQTGYKGIKYVRKINDANRTGQAVKLTGAVTNLIVKVASARTLSLANPYIIGTVLTMKGIKTATRLFIGNRDENF